MPNRVVAEAARQDRLPGLPGLSAVRTEQKYGDERSRIDVLARDAPGPLRLHRGEERHPAGRGRGPASPTP